jgi:SpoIID/LytB domain protein
MLPKNTIPSTEPLIRAGIILPEDRYSEIVLVTPPNSNYILEWQGSKRHIPAKAFLTISCLKNKIHFRVKGRQISGEAQALKITSKKIETIAPKSGIIVKGVISGRDFHWRKKIDITLPGDILLNIQQNKLTLINELPIERYLMCVATSEMNAACPQTLIEAQTITARSWMLANIEQKHIHLGMDVCNDDCCQRYQGTTFLSKSAIAGALNTYGLVLLHNHKICDARYSKSCGGMTEAFENIWENKPHPYLQIKRDWVAKKPEETYDLTVEKQVENWIKNPPNCYCSPQTVDERELKKYIGVVDESGEYFRWKETLKAKALTKHLNQIYQQNIKMVLDIVPIKRGGSGRIKKLALNYLNKEGQVKTLEITSQHAIRYALHPKFLYSSAFIVETCDDVNLDEKKFILRGAGWGHGAGLCQIGALGMSLKKCATEEILYHYFPESILKKIY